MHLRLAMRKLCTCRTILRNMYLREGAARAAIAARKKMAIARFCGGV
jgi:hypothetical protein